MNSYYFLPDDYRDLSEKIVSLTEQMREIGRAMGKSCEEGAETYHDNFAFEDGERQQHMVSARLREMIRIRNSAKLVAASETARDRVAIGRTVTIADEDSGDLRIIRLGSYMVFSGNGTVSYNSPIAKILMGAEVGESRSGRIHKTQRTFEVLNVE